MAKSLGSLKVFWLLPTKTLADGLRLVCTDSDTNVIASVVDRVKNLVIYFDHEDSLVTMEWDDVIANPAADLPKVISPKKVNHIPKKDGEKLPNLYSNLESSYHQSSSKKAQRTKNENSDSGSTDSDVDYEDFLDSDYEWSDGDDDLFADFVDADVDDQGAAKRGKKAKGSRLKGEATQPRIGDLSSDESDLELSNDGDDGVKLNFKTWKEQDMSNPTFSVGLVFPLAVELRAAINEYAIRNRV